MRHVHVQEALRTAAHWRVPAVLVRTGGVAFALAVALLFARAAPGDAQQLDVRASLARADHELTMGRPNGAAGAYREALAAGMSDAFEEAWIGLIRSLRAAGDYQGAALQAGLLLRHRPVQLARVYYLQGRAWLDAGDADAAALAFRSATAEDGVLAPAARFRAAQSLAEASRDVEASAAFSATIVDPRTHKSLRGPAILDGAQTLVRLGRTADALDILRDLARDVAAVREQVAAGHWLATTIRLDAGDPLWSVEARNALLAAPGLPEATLALDALEAEGVAVAPLHAGYVRYRARDDAAASRLYRLVLGRPPPRGARAVRPLVDDPLLTGVNGTLAAHAEAAIAWFYMGALAERAGDVDAATDAYGASTELAPYGRLAADAHWWRGLLLEERGRFLDAALEFDELVARFSNSPFHREAFIRGPLARVRGGDDATARDQLRELILERGGSTGARAARWLSILLPGSLLPAPGDLDPSSIAALLDDAETTATDPLPATALEEWSSPPLDWDGAQLWLQSTLGGRPVGDPRAIDDDRLPLGLALVAVDESGPSRAVLTDMVVSYWQQPHDLLHLAREAWAVGLHDVALTASVSLLSRLSPQQRLETPFTVEQLAYPAPYSEAVLEAARAEGIPPLLLLALVRQESAFNPAALSIADARGLTQVIPQTGQAIADSLGVEWDAADLLKPDRSLRFGAHYLAVQLEQFDGNLLTALAAYNGGPHNAARWLDEQWWPGADGYIHAVGFSETRRYIERVLENYAWYRYLYAGVPRPAIR